MKIDQYFLIYVFILIQIYTYDFDGKVINTRKVNAEVFPSEIPICDVNKFIPVSALKDPYAVEKIF